MQQQTLPPPPSSPTPASGVEGAPFYPRKRWTMRECRVLIENGLLEPGRYELIEGDIVPKVGQGRLHIAVVTRLIAVLAAIFGAEHIQSQAQIGIGALDENAESDPEPDVAVLAGTVRDYLEREPDPATEVHLVAEAADSTLTGDTRVKARLYARYGVPEYWVVDIPHRRLIVYRGPAATGYMQEAIYEAQDSVAPLAAPDRAVLVADLLP